MEVFSDCAYILIHPDYYIFCRRSNEGVQSCTFGKWLVVLYADRIVTCSASLRLCRQAAGAAVFLKSPVPLLAICYSNRLSGLLFRTVIC